MRRQRVEPLDRAGQLRPSPRVSRRTVTAQSTVPAPEHAGRPLPPDQPDRVEAVLLEVAAQRDLGVLHVHRVRRAAAQPVEVDPARPRAASPPGWPSRDPSGRSRAPRAAPACWPRTGRHRCARPPRSRRGATPSARRRRVGPARRSRRRGGRGCRRRTAGPRTASQSGTSPRAIASRSTSSSSAWSSKVRAEQQPAGGEAERTTWKSGSRCALWCRLASSTLMFLWSARCALTSLGQPAVAEHGAPQGPWCSTSRNARRCVAVPASVVQASLGGGRAAEVAGAGGSQRTTSSSPSRTSRRHSTRRGRGVQRRGRRGELVERRARSTASRRPAPARSAAGRRAAGAGGRRRVAARTACRAGGAAGSRR